MGRHAKVNWYEWCDFGKHRIKSPDDHRHIHPIPICQAFPGGGGEAQGGTACLDCYPGVFKLQVEQGLVVPRLESARPKTRPVADDFAEIDEPAPVKRKRGRPRKNPVVVESPA